MPHINYTLAAYKSDSSKEQRNNTKPWDCREHCHYGCECDDAPGLPENKDMDAVCQTKVLLYLQCVDKIRLFAAMNSPYNVLIR